MSEQADVPSVHHWIGGASVPPAGGSDYEDRNPANDELIARVARGNAEDVDRAVQAARAAMASEEWGGIDAHRRGELLWRLADLVDANADELAALETQDNGKPWFESRHVDLPMVARNLRYFAGLADRIEGKTIPVAGPFLNYTLREPVGVVGCIVPWNFPLNIASWKIAPALACGNAVVLKPAEETPLTAVSYRRTRDRGGIPCRGAERRDRVRGEAGAPLVAHPGVDAIAFTGSTEVGRLILREAADSLKKVSVELGGKSPNVVFADADFDGAVRGATSGIFYGAGEVCAAGSRILVEREIHDDFVEALKARAERTTVGDPMAKGTRIGALVSPEHLDRVMGFVEAGNRRERSSSPGVSGCRWMGGATS